MDNFTYTAMRYTPTAKDAQYLAIGASFASTQTAVGYMSQIIPFLSTSTVFPALIAYTAYNLTPPLSKGFYDGMVGTLERDNKRDLERARIKGSSLDAASKESGLNLDKTKADIKPPSKLYQPSLSDLGIAETMVYKTGNAIGKGSAKLLSSTMSVKNRKKFIKNFQKFSRGVNYFWNFLTLKKVRDVCKSSAKGFYSGLKRSFKKQFKTQEELETERANYTSEMEDKIKETLISQKIDSVTASKIAKQTSENKYRELYGESPDEARQRRPSFSSQDIDITSKVNDRESYLKTLTTPMSEEEKTTYRDLLQEARARRANAGNRDDVGINYENFDARAANLASKAGSSVGNGLGKFFYNISKSIKTSKEFLSGCLKKSQANTTKNKEHSFEQEGSSNYPISRDNEREGDYEKTPAYQKQQNDQSLNITAPIDSPVNSPQSPADPAKSPENSLNTPPSDLEELDLLFSARSSEIPELGVTEAKLEAGQSPGSVSSDKSSFKGPEEDAPLDKNLHSKEPETTPRPKYDNSRVMEDNSHKDDKFAEDPEIQAFLQEAHKQISSDTGFRIYNEGPGKSKEPDGFRKSKGAEINKNNKSPNLAEEKLGEKHHRISSDLKKSRHRGMSHE